MRIRPLIALPLALFVALGIAAPAAASTTQQSLMQDDDLVLYRGPDVQASTLQRMAGLGVDTVRINLIWRNVVGKGGRKAQRKPTNPASQDENDAAPLPAVNQWSLWNEPNQAGWLEPQYEKGKPASPGLYRSLFFAGDRSLRRTGHGGDQIYLGETAPLGSRAKSRKAPMGPKTFLGALFRGGKRFPMTGYAHHPYTKMNPPNVPDKSPGAITIANIADLESLLDKSGNVTPGLPILSTEFGYETNPPDPFNGISQDTQAEWLNIGDQMMYNDPRISGNTQFLLRDAEGNARYSPSSPKYWFTYQSGLFNADDTPKPAATAYAMPLVVTPNGGGTASVWGQLRFRPNGAPPAGVQLQFRPQGSADYTNSGPPIGVTDPLGFYSGTVADPGPGTFRAVWSSTTEAPFSLTSREVNVSS
jgi:hypothetical protein